MYICLHAPDSVFNVAMWAFCIVHLCPSVQFTLSVSPCLPQSVAEQEEPHSIDLRDDLHHFELLIALCALPCLPQSVPEEDARSTKVGVWGTQPGDQEQDMHVPVDSRVSADMVVHHVPNVRSAHAHAQQLGDRGGANAGGSRWPGEGPADVALVEEQIEVGRLGRVRRVAIGYSFRGWWRW